MTKHLLSIVFYFPFHSFSIPFTAESKFLCRSMICLNKREVRSESGLDNVLIEQDTTMLDTMADSAIISGDVVIFIFFFVFSSHFIFPTVDLCFPFAFKFQQKKTNRSVYLSPFHAIRSTCVAKVNSQTLLLCGFQSFHPSPFTLLDTASSQLIGCFLLVQFRAN